MVDGYGDFAADDAGYLTNHYGIHFLVDISGIISRSVHSMVEMSSEDSTHFLGQLLLLRSLIVVADGDGPAVVVGVVVMGCSSPTGYLLLVTLFQRLVELLLMRRRKKKDNNKLFDCYY